MGSSYCLCQLLSPSSWVFVPPLSAVPALWCNLLALCIWKLLLKILFMNCVDVCVHPSWCFLLLHRSLVVTAHSWWGAEGLPQSVWKDTSTQRLLWGGRVGPCWYCKVAGGILTSPVLCRACWKINCISPGMRHVMQLISQSTQAGKCMNHPDLPWNAQYICCFLGWSEGDCISGRSVIDFHGFHVKIIKVREGNRSAFLISDVIF